MLVPVDCSEFCEAALELAERTARQMNAEVHLVAVLPPEHEHATLRPIGEWYPTYDSGAWRVPENPGGVMVETRDQAIEATRQEAFEYLRRSSQRFEGLPVTVRVLLRKSIAEAIISYADDLTVDLIVMATHGRKPFAQAIMGSVAAEVMHSGVAPCLLVKPQAAQ